MYIEEVPENSNIIQGRCILPIKNEITGRQVWKAPFLVQGHKDILKKILAHDFSVAKQHSIDLLLGYAAVLGLCVFSRHVIQAYIQSAETLKIDIFIAHSKDSS